MTECAQGPNQRLTVWHIERRAEQGAAKLGILGRCHHGVHVAYADVVAATRGDPGVDPVQRPLVVDQAQRHAENVDVRRGAKLNRRLFEGTLRVKGESGSPVRGSQGPGPRTRQISTFGRVLMSSNAGLSCELRGLLRA